MWPEAANSWRSLRQENIAAPEENALLLPRKISDREYSTIVRFLDEFQNTRLPHEKYDIVGFMGEAVESPHLSAFFHRFDHVHIIQSNPVETPTLNFLPRSRRLC